MISIIRTKDIKGWEKTGKWVLVYGRRKTGKSFFVKNFTDWDRYFFIGRSGEILEGDENITYEVFLREAFRCLDEEKKIVIDEIQRLPGEFRDRLHQFGVKGNLVAISSTMQLIKDLLGKKSPLMGLFSEFQLNLIDERDIIKNLSGRIKDEKRLIETCVYLREPWLIPFWEKSGKDFLSSMAIQTKISVPALIGEIFSEEEKSLSKVYEGVLKSIADGKRVSGEITNHLYSSRLIKAQNPSLVHPYLKILHDLGLLEKMKVFGKNKYYYFHVSPVMDLYYYLDAKYGFSERDVPEKQVEKIMKEKTPLHIESFFRNLFSKKFGLWKVMISEKDYEVDIGLTDFKKLKVVGEVKWKEDIELEEIKRIEEVLKKFDCKKILVVPNKDSLPVEPDGIEVWDINRIKTDVID